MNLEQPVGHRVPVAQQLVVARHAEVERLAQAAHRGQLRVVGPVFGRRRRRVEADVGLHVAQDDAEQLQVFAQVIVGLRAHRALLRHGLWPRAEDVGRQHVEDERLVNGLARVLPEEGVAPGDQIVQVGHDRLVHVGLLAIAGHDVRPEGGVLPGVDALNRLVAQRFVGVGGQIDQNLLDLPHVGRLEGAHLPEALGRRAIAVVGGVEQEVEPALRLGVAPRLAQVHGDGQRHVEEQLPVVDRIRPAAGEVQVFDGVGRRHQGRRVVTRWAEDVAVEHRPRRAVGQCGRGVGVQPHDCAVRAPGFRLCAEGCRRARGRVHLDLVRQTQNLVARQPHGDARQGQRHAVGQMHHFAGGQVQRAAVGVRDRGGVGQHHAGVVLGVGCL